MHGSLKRLAAPAPTVLRSRRQRRAKREARSVLHLVMPGLEAARAEPRPRETVSAFLRRTGWAQRDRKYGWQFRKGLPTILEINGEAVLRKHWARRRIAANDNVRFVSYPLGGGGSSGTKQVIGLVALIAVSAFAIWAGPAIAAAAGLTGAAATIGGGAATALIGLGGSLLVNALVGPKSGATNSPDATQDQIYSVQAQGNTAKLGQPLPVWYGRLKAYPDFAATPWAEFVGNDQWLNVLLSPTMGSLDYEALYLGDTVLWTPGSGISASFPGAQVAFYEPGATVTLFPTNVDQSVEVSGQQLPDGGGDEGGQYDPGFGPLVYGTPLGPFVANPSGTQTQAIAIDIVFPSGCFTVNQDNNNNGYSKCTLLAEYAPCNDAGTQTGAFSTLFQVTEQFNSTSPVRNTIKVDVAPGRYLVRLSRKGINSQSKYGVDTVLWAGLRSFLKGSNSFPDVSTVAIRLKASQSTQGSYKFGVLGTRKLPVWNGSAFVLQATRSNAWAFLDAVTNAQYGSGLTISKVDFNAVVAHAAGCTSRGDTFDYRLTTAVAVPDMLDKILTPSRARHFWLGDTVSIVRDEWRDVPTMMLTDREIVRDSTAVTFTMLGDEDPDAVIVEYVDETTWLPAQVQYPPDGDTFTAANAETKRIDGIVNRDQAFRECAFYYLQSIYRRENVEIGTEYEGRAITFGSVVRVQSELPQNYGYGGAVTAVAGNTLTLDPAPIWDTGPFYIRLRRSNGTFFGPVLCTEGVDAAHAVLDATSLAAAQTAQSTTLSAVLAREDGGEYPSFELGSGISESKLCVVLGGVPNGELCTLSLVVDDQRVHATDLGTPPLLPTVNYPFNPKVPLIVGLNATFGQGAAEPKLSASWFPTAGAVYYIAEITLDSGQSWAQVYEGQDNKFDAVVTLAALTLRVQAVNGTVRGPYSTVDLAAPTITVMPGTVALTSLVEGIKYQVTTLQDMLNDKISEVEQRIASIASNQDARNWIDKKEVRSQLAARADDALAQIDDVRTVAVDTQTAYASFSTAATATFGSTTAFVSQTATAISTFDGYAAAQYAITLDVNGYAIGFNLINGGSGTGSATFVVNKFQIAAPGTTGGAPVPIFTVANVNGLPKVALRGDMFVDGIITGTMVQAGAIQAVHIAANSIDASKIVAGSISTGQIAVGGVDLPNIIAGAVSNTQVFGTAQNTNMTAVTQLTLLSQSVNIQSGKATIMLCAAWTCGTSSQVGSAADAFIDFYVDGALVKTFDWAYIYNAGGDGYYRLVGPFTVHWTVIGLSAGNHTFAIVERANAPHGILAGQAYITDFRR